MEISEGRWAVDKPVEHGSSATPTAVLAAALAPGDFADSTVAADRTRVAVARLILERGPQTAAGLAEQLGLSPAAIRRHLDALVAARLLVESQPRRPVQRGRGRPARTYAITDAGRAMSPHAYDDLASTALRYLHAVGGESGVLAFAEHRAATLEHTLLATSPPTGTDDRAHALAAALSAQGYAAVVESAGGPGINGVQIVQHHCPIAHVAAEFPQLCEAETRAFARVLGTYVQRLATIAHGDGVCTTHIPLPVGTDSVRPAARNQPVQPELARRPASPHEVVPPTTSKHQTRQYAAQTGSNQ